MKNNFGCMYILKKKDKEKQRPTCRAQMWPITTDIHQRYQTLRHLDPDMGLNLGSSGFPRNQNNHGLSGA